VQLCLIYIFVKGTHREHGAFVYNTMNIKNRCVTTDECAKVIVKN